MYHEADMYHGGGIHHGGEAFPRQLSYQICKTVFPGGVFNCSVVHALIKSIDSGFDIRTA